MRSLNYLQNKNKKIWGNTGQIEKNISQRYLKFFSERLTSACFWGVVLPLVDQLSLIKTANC
jgi:hypothetical protein